MAVRPKTRGPAATLELAHAVRHLLTASDAPELDRNTRSGRIEAALCNHGIRG
ncbi:hypothetical protein IPZ70_04905 [Streptomyces polychromogenes]|nr:hypothetical protein [Streptomyces polychromogenes]